MSLEDLIRREVSAQGLSLTGLAKACDKSHSWLDRLLARNADPKLSDAIKLAEQLNLTLDDLAEAQTGVRRSRLPMSHAKSMLADLAKDLATAALKDLEINLERSALDELFIWWRNEGADVDRLGNLAELVDVYLPPSDGVMTAVSIGERSLASRTLPRADVDLLNVILRGSDRTKTKPLVDAQEKALQTGVCCDYVQLSAPVGMTDRVSVDYMRILFRATENGEPRIVNYSKEV